MFDSIYPFCAGGKKREIAVVRNQKCIEKNTDTLFNGQTGA